MCFPGTRLPKTCHKVKEQQLSDVITICGATCHETEDSQCWVSVTNRFSEFDIVSTIRHIYSSLFT